jgi:purine-binding chemotaxis protein CheW
VDSAPAGVTPDEAAGPAGVAEETTTTREAETRVLEFTLADEQYCLDIEYIEEIVKEETVTRVPNTPAFVEGVVDLRGQITTILNPKVALEKGDRSPGDLIVVFDAGAFDDQGATGWVVDDVRQVSPVTDGQVNDPPMGEDYINGVIDRPDDEGFVIWTTPDLALDGAE